MQRSLLFVAAVAVLAFSQVTSAQFNPNFFCYNVLGNGAIFQLKNLSFTKYMIQNVTIKGDPLPNYSLDFDVSFCQPSTLLSRCTSENGAICTQSSGALHFFAGVMGAYNMSTGQPLWSLIDAKNPEAGVHWVFNNGYMYYSNQTIDYMSVQLQLKCDRTADPALAKLTLVQDSPFHDYTFSLTSWASCPSYPPPTPFIPGTINNGLSGGSVFLIVFFCLLFVYIVGGCIYKTTVMSTTGIESCPQIEFWRELPGYVADGWKYVWDSITGCCGGPSQPTSGYADI